MNFNETLETVENKLRNNWDKCDIQEKKEIKDRIKSFETRKETNEFIMSLSNHQIDLLAMNEEQIKEENKQAAHKKVMDFNKRICKITGNIEEWVTFGTGIDGIVTGEKGKARVQEVSAGGYNIQRLHVRVLVKKIQD